MHNIYPSKVTKHECITHTRYLHICTSTLQCCLLDFTANSSEIWSGEPIFSGSVPQKILALSYCGFSGHLNQVRTDYQFPSQKRWGMCRVKELFWVQYVLYNWYFACHCYSRVSEVLLYVVFTFCSTTVLCCRTDMGHFRKNGKKCDNLPDTINFLLKQIPSEVWKTLNEQY